LRFEEAILIERFPTPGPPDDKHHDQKLTESKQGEIITQKVADLDQCRHVNEIVEQFQPSDRAICVSMKRDILEVSGRCEQF